MRYSAVLLYVIISHVELVCMHMRETLKIVTVKSIRKKIGLKPHEVYFFGKKCKYYQSQEDLNRAIAALNKKKP